jgi:hypothetical protein
MFKEFRDEVERGNTYPQEGPIDIEGFRSYFFAADVCLGILDLGESSAVPDDLESALGARTWQEAFAGCYYVSICSGCEGLSQQVMW